MGQRPLVLVTGASGFVGSHLAERLAGDGARVRCLLRESSDDRWLRGVDVLRVAGDVTDPDSLSATLGDVRRVYHVAGLVCARSLAEYRRVNRDGTRNLIEACARFAPKLERFVLVSSLAAAGPSPPDQPATETKAPCPVSDYGRSKAEAEEVALAAADRLPITIVRPPAVYGPRDTQVHQGFQAARYGLCVCVGPPGQIVNFVHVQDLVDGIVRAGTHEAAVGEIFFIGSEVNYEAARISKTIARAIRDPLVTVAIPRWALWTAGVLAEVVQGVRGRAAHLNRQKVLELTASHWCLSVEKARRVLGYRQTVELENGIAQTARWYESRGWL